MIILSNRVRIAGLAAALAAVTLLAAPGFARADAVRDWNLNATTALAAQDARVAVLHLAMVHGAVYDAVNAIDRGYRPYLVSPRAKPWDSPDAAAATAAYRVLVGIVPEQKPALEALYASSLAAIPDGPMKAGGIHAGETAAAAMIAERTNDGRFGSPGLPTGTMPGQWRPALPMFVNDPSGWIRNVTPFLIDDASQFRSHGPFPLASPEIRGGLRGGEGRRLRDEHDANRRSDQRRSLLGRESAGHLDPHRSHAVTARRGCRLPTTPATSRCCT